MTNPYADQPPQAFWSNMLRQGVETDIFSPRVSIDKTTRVACAGSCFAQHIGRELKARGCAFVDLEPPPPNMEPEDHAAFGLDLYSARYGNIYSARQLRQLFERASGAFAPLEAPWRTEEGGYQDPFRPTIEPGGFSSEDELAADRRHHLAQVARLFEETDVFVFTFGLTEGWECRADGAALPACPGTVGGTFDAEAYAFRNYGFREVHEDASTFIALARAANPEMRFVFTVSPVPLTATATGGHALAATVYSKSVLRAVCGALVEEFEGVDYFPSYEIIAGHPNRAKYYMPNMRHVSAEGVATAMGVFFAAHGIGEAVTGPAEDGPEPEGQAHDDLVCEEEALEAMRDT